MPDSPPYPTTPPPWAKGMRRISSGVYADGIHIYISRVEVCQAWGKPPTKANCDAVIQMWNDAIENKWGKRVPITEEED